MKKHHWHLLFILLASLLLSLLYIPKNNIIQGDKDIYRYVGLVIQKGGVPYRDVFDHKPPLIFFLNYAALLMGGDWGQWIIDTSLALLATGLFFGLCKRHKLSFPWVLPLLFNLMLRDWFICLVMGMTREYTTVLLLIFFCVLLGRHRLRYNILGFLAGLIFFMQQDQVFALIPFFIYAFLPDKDVIPFWSRLLRTAVGFGAVLLPIILYFAWNNSLIYFWQDAFLFNMTWYTTTLKESFFDHLRKLKLIFDQGNYELPVLVSFTLGTCALFFRTGNRRLILAALAAALLSIAPEFLGGRDIVPNIHEMSFTHYVLPLSASLPILLFCVFAFSEEPVLQNWKAQAINGFFVCASLFYIAVQHFVNRQIARGDDGNSLITVYLVKHKPGDYQLFSFGNNNYLYINNELEILAPSKWVYQHFWYLYDTWDRDHLLLQSMAQDLLRHRTTYVIQSALREYFRDASAYDWWMAFLQEHYEKLPLPQEDGRTTLWKLKDKPE